MKLLVLTASISRKSGGLYDAIRLLYREMPTDISIFGIKDEYTKKDGHGWKDLDINCFEIKAFKSFGYAPDMMHTLKSCYGDIIHLHGLWMYPQLVALKFKNKFRKPMVISPHGMLDSWAINNSSWKKKIVGCLFANKSLKRANCIHALCESEYNAIRAYGLKNPVAIIPNGINLHGSFRKKDKDKSEKKTLLFIGRLHPKKGLTLLIEALGILKKEESVFFETWQIEIVGWDQEGHTQVLKGLVQKYKLDKNVHFAGALFNEEKELKLRNADAFILPSYSEGLPMSILEAWAYQLPVLMTEECNLSEGFLVNGAIKLNLNAIEISKSLKILQQLSNNQLREIGENGFKLVKAKFTWKKIARDMSNTYNWLLGNSEKPDFVKLD